MALNPSVPIPPDMYKALSERDPNVSKPKAPAQVKALNKPTSTSQKRAHDSISISANKGEDSPNESQHGDLPDFDSVTEDCNQIRRKINRFIDNGGMGLGEFQRAIGVSSASYGTFMKQSGKAQGSQSDTYPAASAFFKKREHNGEKMPRAKKAKTSDTAAGAKKGNEDGKKLDVDGITLEGEAEGKVEIYETCDSMRRTIAAHLRRDGMTAAALCREISKCFGDDPKTITSAQLTAFRGKHGPKSGNSAAVFYGAYVYFEKLRIKDGKPKSKFRNEMEDIWKREKGFDLRYSGGGYLCGPGERVSEDKYGAVYINGRRI